MKNIVKLSTTVTFVLSAFFLYASKDHDFEPSRKTFAKVYSNFHAGISNSDQRSAFEITRAYFGYKHNFDPNFSATLKLDIGSPNDESQYSLLRRYAYFKNAALHYRYEKLTVNFGLIDLFQFKLQEKFWDRRYIYKSFQDEYRYGSSADIGISLFYQLNKYILLQAGLMNGEGYKQLQLDNIYKTALSTEFTVGKLTSKLYFDYTEEKTAQTTYGYFIGYKRNIGSLGYEYNHKRNHNFNEGKNQHGQSFYASFHINDKIQLFGRYDIVRSNILAEDVLPWNLSNDGSAVLTGVQYSPVKNVKMALNYQDWYPYAMDEPNLAYIYFNVEFSF